MKGRVLLREPVSVALETLRSHKMRPFLMLLGIILSASTLIVIIAQVSESTMFPCSPGLASLSERTGERTRDITAIDLTSESAAIR